MEDERIDRKIEKYSKQFKWKDDEKGAIWDIVAGAQMDLKREIMRAVEKV